MENKIFNLLQAVIILQFVSFVFLLILTRLLVKSSRENSLSPEQQILVSLKKEELEAKKREEEEQNRIKKEQMKALEEEAKNIGIH